MKTEGFQTIKIVAGKLREYDDGKFVTLLSGFVPDSEVDLPAGYTHMGVVVEGEITLEYSYNNITRSRHLIEGDFFSAAGASKIISKGLGMVNSAKDYHGLNLIGGPLEDSGRLLYIDGCTDSLLIPPLKKGDPCLNHLHFPTNIVQTPHTHPSVRCGLVFKGRGVCVVPGGTIPLEPGHAFIIETNGVHSFNTEDSTMDIIAFHPDSDVGVTDDDHPMVNRTIVDGVSASGLESIRTKKVS